MAIIFLLLNFTRTSSVYIPINGVLVRQAIHLGWVYFQTNDLVYKLLNESVEVHIILCNVFLFTRKST